MHVHRFKQFLQRTSPLITLALLAALLLSVVPPWLAHGAGPVIEVEGNEQPIAHASTTPSTANHTDFGTVTMPNSLIRTFTIKNTGDAQLILGTIAVSGNQAADFKVTQPTSNVINANASATFQVEFKPTVAGLRKTQVRIPNNANTRYDFMIQGTGDGPIMAVEGNGQPIDHASTTPSEDNHTDFGTVTMPGTLIRTFTIKNTGVSDLTLGNITVSGNQAGDFTVTQPSPTTVSPSGSVTFNVTFTPGATGLRKTQVRIPNNFNTRYDFMIQGTGSGPIMGVEGNGQPIAHASTTPSEDNHTDFGTVTMPGTITRTFTIKNTGASALMLNTITVSGNQANDFTVTQPASTTVPSNGSITFDVAFTPGATGLRKTQVRIPNNFNTRYDFTIQGTGSGPIMEVQGNGQPIVHATNANVPEPSLDNHTDFGEVVMPSTAIRTFTIKNTGVSALTLGNITFSGNQASDFAVTTAPASTVAPGDETTFVVTFTPSATGLRRTQMRIVNNFNGRYDVNIRGTSVGPVMGVEGNGQRIDHASTKPSEDNHTDFGSVTMPNSQPRTFTIRNTGQSDLTLGTIVVSGNQASDFAVEQPAATTIPPNQSTTFNVTFTPSGTGVRGTQVRIPNNFNTRYDFRIQGTGSGPQIGVEGNGQPIPHDTIEVSLATGTDFGMAQIGGTPVTRTFTIRNTGSVDLKLTGKNLVATSGGQAGEFKVTQPETDTIAPGGSTTFQIRFEPANPGTRTTRVQIASNDINPYRFTISGVGTGGTPNVDPVITDGNDPREITSANGEPATIELAATDADQDPLTWSITDEPEHGTAAFVDGQNTGSPVTISYTPNPGYEGEDSFDVQVSDGKGGSDSVTVNVTVTDPVIEVTPTPTSMPTATPTTTPMPTATPTMTPTATPGPPLEVTISIQGGSQGSLGSIKGEFEKEGIDLDKVRIESLPEKGDLVLPEGLMRVLAVGDEISAADLDKLVFIPNPGATGTDSFTLVGIDTNGVEYTMNITLTIAPPTVYLPIIVR